VLWQDWVLETNRSEAAAAEQGGAASSTEAVMVKVGSFPAYPSNKHEENSNCVVTCFCAHDHFYFV